MATEIADPTHPTAPARPSAMPRVLVLAYFFPPLGGAGTQRTTAFVERLPGRGFAPVVVTGPARPSLDWAPEDTTLGHRAEAAAEVVRVEGPEPERTGGWHGRMQRWLRIPEPFSRWWVEGAVSGARAAVDRPDLVYASMSPFESASAAAELAAGFGCPWVADLRDPWALDEAVEYSTALHRALERRRMRSALSSAAGIVMNTPEATAQLLRHFPELDRAIVATIPNGFDPRDFDGPPPRRDDDRFRIVHAGFVHDDWSASASRRLLRGVSPGYDMRARSHVHLLEAVDRLRRTRPELMRDVEVHLAGVVGDATRRELPSYVHVHGYLSHDRTVELLRSADLLFLPMHDLQEGIRARIVPGKTYEYLAARRPILAALPDGDARDLLGRAGGAVVCRPTDVGAMARALERQLEGRLEGVAQAVPAADVVAEFERGRQADRLAELFGQVLGAAVGRQTSEATA